MGEAVTRLEFARPRVRARMRILLVEDNATDAELTRACLDEATRAGAEIVHARTLAEGLRALQTAEVHLTLLDLDLPDSSGFDTLEKMSAAARGPVIVLTGNPHPALVAEGLKRHAYEVMRKSELDAVTLMRLVRLASLQGHTENSLRLTEQRYRELVDLEARFRATFEHAAVGIAH